MGIASPMIPLVKEGDWKTIKLRWNETLVGFTGDSRMRNFALIVVKHWVFTCCITLNYFFKHSVNFNSFSNLHTRWLPNIRHTHYPAFKMILVEWEKLFVVINNQTMNSNKVSPPFPRLKSYPACLTVLGYYGRRCKCVRLLKRLSRNSRRYLKRHAGQIKGGTKAKPKAVA